MKKIRADLDHLKFYGEERHHWKSAVIEWGIAAAGTIAPSTLERYRISLRNLRGILDELYVDEITTRTMAKIAKRKGVSNATRRRDLTAVSVVLRYCASQGWRDDNPARAWDRSIIRERRDPIILPAVSDIDGVVRAAPGNFAHMIRLAQYTGMREEECASLDSRQYRKADGVIDLWKTKTNRPRAVPLDSRAVGTITGTPAYLGSTWVFWHHEGERYHNVASQFRRVMKQAVRLKKVERPFRFHDLRHWYAVDYLRRGGNIYDLQQILGHASIRTTERYLDFLTPDEQRKAKHGPAQNPAHV